MRLSPILSAFFIVTTFAWAAGPAVTALSPQPESLGTPVFGEIVISFDRALDPASLSAQTLTVMGRWSGINQGTLQLEEGDTRLRFTPDEPFSHGEWVWVHLGKTLKDLNGDPMDSGYAWGFWTFTRATPLTLTEVDRIDVRREGEGHIQTYGAHALDLNNDGFSDYTVPNERSNDIRVFLNDGQGNYGPFSIIALPNANRPSTNEAADFDGDGIADLAIGSTTNSNVNICFGDGAGGYNRIESYPAGQGVRGLTILDLENDGDMDIVTANRNAGNLAILHNQGNGVFDTPEMLNTSGGGESAIAAADVNRDGILDLYVGAYSSGEMSVLLGDGNGGLQESAISDAGGDPWMIAVGDLNGDGFSDVVSANADNGTAGVMLADGSGGFLSANTYPSGNTFPLAIDLGDLDGDGDLDMMISNYGGSWRLFANDGSGNFSTVADYDAEIAASCAVLHDRDNDGDLDVTAIDEIADLLFIFDNPATGIGDENPPAVQNFRLAQNYPNPFNPATTIEFELQQGAQISLSVFDVQGREVAVLAAGSRAAGLHRVVWEGKGPGGASVGSGLYFYRLRAGNQVQSKKMLLVR